MNGKCFNIFPPFNYRIINTNGICATMFTPFQLVCISGKKPAFRNSTYLRKIKYQIKVKL